jgi:hypothetical protein
MLLKKIGQYVSVGLIGLAAFVILVAGFDRLSQMAEAQIAVPGQSMVATGTCQLTSLSASTALASCSGGIPSGSNAVVLRAEAQALRYRSDAGVAASTAGVPMLVADPPLFYQGNLAGLRFIESTSGGKLNVLFYRASR